MIHKTCLRCGRKLTAAKSQKIGYGPTCAKKANYEESLNYSNMEAIMEKSNDWDSCYVEYRKSGLINASKVINRTSFKPTLKLDSQTEGCYGTFFHSDQSIAIQTKKRNQHQKIGTYIHELIHARRYQLGYIDFYHEIDGSRYNISEEIIAELGQYIFFLKVGAFKNPESARKYLSHILDRIKGIFLNRVSEYNKALYLSRLLTLYDMAEEVIDFFMEGL